MEETSNHDRSTLREYFEALLIAAIFLGFANTFVVKTFYIPSASMEDTLLIGDHLFVNRFIFGAEPGVLGGVLPSRAVQRGDIVIFRSVEDPKIDMVKRCVGVPGDTIEVRDKDLYLNGKRVDDDSYTQHQDPTTYSKRPGLSRQQRIRDNFGPYTVPAGSYFCMGDNRDRSWDSRYWGTVPEHYIKGPGRDDLLVVRRGGLGRQLARLGREVVPARIDRRRFPHPVALVAQLPGRSLGRIQGMGHKPLLREYLEALLIAVIFATFARTFVLQAFKIPTGSMEENLLVGDHVLVNKFVYGTTLSPLESSLLPRREIRRGDVVVFKFPEDPSRDFIKRCVGLPGDVIQVDNKRLKVNGSLVDDLSYTRHADPRTYPRSLLMSSNYRKRDNYGPYTVPEGNYFCMGDNRDNSNDSRFWGPVPAGNVLGRAFMIYWSFDDDNGGTDTGTAQAAESRPDTTGPLGRFHQLGWTLSRLFTHTRWERSFQIVH